jgi:predicted MFS family arabinose efflux permease
LGGLYLAYDFVGGRRGPLALVTRVFTYSLVFGLSYVFTLGFRFAFIACLGMGISLGMEYHRVREARTTKTRRPTASTTRNYVQILQVALIRSAAVGLALTLTVAPTVGLVYWPAYSLYVVLYNYLGLAPVDIHLVHPLPTPRLRPLVYSLIYGLGATGCLALAYWLSGTSVPRPAFTPLRFGAAVAGTAFFVSIVSPVIEYWSDRMSRQTLALLGISFAVAGFLLQALPSWIVLLQQ